MSEIQTLEEKRKEHGINKTIMGELVYGSPAAWGMALKRNGTVYEKTERKAEFVFEYHEDRGIVPEPREVPDFE